MFNTNTHAHLKTAHKRRPFFQSSIVIEGVQTRVSPSTVQISSLLRDILHCYSGMLLCYYPFHVILYILIMTSNL